MNLTFIQQIVEKEYGGNNYEVIIQNSSRKNKIQICIRWTREDGTRDFLTFYTSITQISKLNNFADYARQLIIEKKSRDSNG
tara:strand:- start:332 stop:577 length:246 start_codon:yes stop_codon:yes gene_type:complete